MFIIEVIRVFIISLTVISIVAIISRKRHRYRKSNISDELHDKIDIVLVIVCSVLATVAYFYNN